jgi:pimeloyl-ACP methyl ester carboxylesterase
MDEVRDLDRLESAVYAEHGLERDIGWVDLSTTGGRVRVAPSGSGEPVLLVHGLGSNGTTMAPLVGKLRGVRAIVPDMPGFGGSDPIDYRAVDLRALAIDMLTRVLDTNDVDRATVVGTSMGGLWTLWFASDRPERVSRIVELATPALVLGTSAPIQMRLLSVNGLGERMLGSAPSGRAGVERVLKILGESPETIAGLSPALVELNAAIGATRVYQASFLSLLRAGVRLRGANPRWAFGERDLARLGLPMLTVWGGRDPFGSLSVARRFAAISRSELIELPEAGHLPWLRDAATIADAISRFVSTGTPSLVTAAGPAMG